MSHMDQSGPQCNRDKSLGSILEDCQAPAKAKIHALCLLLNIGSPSDLIKIMGRSRGHYYRIVKDPTESKPLVEDICQHLGVDPRDIWPPQEAVNS